MTAAWLLLRAQLRGRWRHWLSLALLVGAFAGAVTAVTAGARRTDSAYPRLLTWSKAPDLLIASGYTPSAAPLPRAALARLPQAVDVGYAHVFDAVTPGDINLIAPEDNHIGGVFWRRKMLAGGLADPGRGDEVNVSFTLAQERHLRTGDTLRVVLRSAAGKLVTFTFQIAGIDAAPEEFPPQIGSATAWVWATPAFYRAHRPDSRVSIAALRLRHGVAGLARVQRELSRRAGGKLLASSPLAAQSANTERSIHLQAVALWQLAGLLAVIAMLVIGQLLTRLSLLEATEYRSLRALGMSRHQLLAAGLGRAVLIGAAAAAAGLILAVALSLVFPVGMAGIAEPQPGIQADWPVLALGAIGALLATFGCACWPAWQAASKVTAAEMVPPMASRRTRPVSSVLAANAGSVSGTAGVRLALQPGAGRTALPVRSTIAGAVIGVTALTAAIVFSASLSHLLASPRLYGVTWDAQVANTTDARIAAATRAVARDAQVAGWSTGYSGAALQVGGVRVDGIAMSPGRGGSFTAAPVEGRLPRRPSEIALGARTLSAIHSHIGATTEVSVSGYPAARFKIVGTAVFPTLSDGLGLGQGAALTIGGAHQLFPATLSIPPPDTLLVRFRPGIEPQHATDVLASRVAQAGPFIVQGPAVPTDLVNFGRVQNLPILLGVGLGGLALATIAHLLVTSVRRRRRDFAILRTLGFTRWQVRRTVAWQAATLAGIALVIGLPLGIVGGRAGWQIFSHQLGIQPVFDIPLGQFAAMIPLALGLAVAIAALPGESAARVRPAQILRSE